MRALPESPYGEVRWSRVPHDDTREPSRTGRKLPTPATGKRPNANGTITEAVRDLQAARSTSRGLKPWNLGELRLTKLLLNTG